MNRFAVRPELRAIKRRPELWVRVAKAWRAAPVLGPIIHVSADGRAHVNTVELGLRLGREGS